MNAGTLNILCNGETGEGDGIDSNGWLVINGGTVISQACFTSADSGIDSDKGIYINGGKIVASGNMLDHIAGGLQTYAIFNFANKQNGNNTYKLKDSNGKLVDEYSPKNAFTHLIISDTQLVEGEYSFWQNDTQLGATKSTNMQIDGMNQGEKPKIPQGVPPAQSNNTNKFEKPNVQPPQLPNGERPRGERPNYPNAEFSKTPENMTISNNILGGNTPFGEISPIINIAKGGNNFTNVCALKQ